MNRNEDAIDQISELKKILHPPTGLEDRVISQLARKGLIRRRFKWMRSVAAILIFAVGAAAGKFVWKPAPVQYSHVLLLKEDAVFFQRNAHESSLVREYSDWAGNIRSHGTLIRGDKLEISRVLLPPSVDSSEVIAGFFLLKADSDQAALEIAQSCPHLKHGGAIELRRIDTATN